MIVDSSALVAIMQAEPEAAEFLAAMRDVRVRASTATLLETAMVLGPEVSARLDTLIEEVDMELVAFDSAHLAVARGAVATYGKGRGHPARLNFGDCMTYALAKTLDEPLLFKGDDFAHTDITPAIRR